MTDRDFGRRLPDWLADVPMDAPRPTWVSVSKAKAVPAEMLQKALDAQVGSSIGSFAIAPDLAKQFAQFTENPSWGNLPAEPTWLTRIGEDSWEVRVGEFTGSFGRQDLQAKLREALGPQE